MPQEKLDKGVGKEVSEAMERWRKSKELSKKCGEKVKEAGLKGEEAMSEYLACRMEPREHGIKIEG